MSLTAKIRGIVNNTTDKINKKLNEIETKKITKIAIKEEMKIQKINKKNESKRKNKEKIVEQKEKNKAIIRKIIKPIISVIIIIKTFFNNKITQISLFFYKILSKCSKKIETIYVVKDYKKSVKEHKKLIELLYNKANIEFLSKNHDADLLTNESIKYAINGIEPPNHRYVNKHHVEYWLKDNKILEIPFVNTLEIMCELFASAYDKQSETVDYALLIELFNDKTEEYFINEVLVKYIRNSILHAQEKKLVAPDHTYCKKIYNEQVLF